MSTLDLTGSQVLGYLLVAVRVGAFLWLAPPFGGRTLPVQVRVMLAMALALPMTGPALKASGGVPTTVTGIVASVVMQVVVGVALGLVCLTLLAAIQSAGALLDLFGGFSLSQSYDPLLQQQNSILGRIYQLLAGVLLLVTGGYFMILRGLSLTFEALPLDGVLSLATTAQTLLQALSDMFLAALQIAGPLIGVLLLIDVGLGLLTRVAPTLNAFSLGFPLKIGVLLLLIIFALPLLPPAVTGLSEDAVQAMSQITGG